MCLSVKEGIVSDNNVLTGSSYMGIYAEDVIKIFNSDGFK